MLNGCRRESPATTAITLAFSQVSWVQVDATMACPAGLKTYELLAFQVEPTAARYTKPSPRALWTQPSSAGR